MVGIYKILAALVACLTLSACFAPQVVRYTDRTIIIRDQLGVAETFAIAERFCHSQGGSAVFTQKVNNPVQCFDGHCFYFVCLR